MASVATEKLEVRPSPDRLREVLSYDAETGEFRYLIRVAQRAAAGDVAGSVNTEGYRHIRVGGRAYKAHRLAIFYVTGKWPQSMVDHIDEGRDNNRFANLREATRSQNLANSRLYRAGKSSRKGVRCQSNGRWSARIQRDLKPTFLGYYSSETEAGAAYDAAAQELFGSFAKGSAA